MERTYFLYLVLGLALGGLGRHEEAVEALREATILAPGHPYPQSHLGWALGLAGKRQEALAILENLDRRRSRGYVGGVYSAQVYVGLGDNDQAISSLQQAAGERDGMMVFLSKWPVFDPLRADPRFQASAAA